MSLAGKVAAIAFVSALSASASAIDIGIGQPASGGSGCPGGSLVASVRNGRIHIAFDEYVVESGRPTARRVDRKTCNVAIPIKLPPGFSIAILDLDYRGFVNIPRGGKGQITTESFFVGKSGSKVTTKLPVGGPQLFRVSHSADASTWSECGADTILRVNTSLLAQTNSRNQRTIAALESADANAGILVGFSSRACR